MLSTLRMTPRDAPLPVAESSAMALARLADHTAQAGSPINIVTPGLSLFNECLLDFQNTAQSLTSTLYGELEAIFSHINIHDISPSHKAPKTSSRSSSKSCKFRDSTYIEPAYNWLLINIHNPYPSKASLSKIAHKAKSDVKSVEAWFVDARSRIGWTILRKTQFGNKQADIVDAAKRFFVQPDERRPLGEALEMEFTQVEVATKSLYADKFEQTTLAAKLDVAVKDLTPEMKEQARQEALKRRQTASSYPSPLRSPARSPEPVEFSPLEQDLELYTTLPDAIFKRKCRSVSPEADDNTSTNRPAKRTRAETSLSRNTPSLPSPTPSSHEPLRESAPPPPPPAANSTPSPISRKRRLSDADGQGAPKRPCSLSARPQLQTVSDPLPVLTNTLFEVTDINNWFSSNFGNCSPVTVDPLDDPLGLDLDFYTYSDVDTPSTATESLDAQSPAPQGTDLVTTVVGDDTFSNGLDISTNTFDYNKLFDDYEQPPLPSQEFGYQIPDALPASQPPLSEFPFLTNLPAIPYTPAYDPLPAIDATHPTLLDSSANIDWNFSAFGSLEVEDSFGAVDLLPNFSGGNLFQRVTPFLQTSLLPVATLGIQGSKKSGNTAIQMQLAAMKEEMRRLEERIAQSS